VRQFNNQKGDIVMRKKYVHTLAVLVALSITVLNYGCDSQGPAEKAGEKVDQSIEKTQDAVEQITDKITGKGPAEELGEKIDETVEKIEESTTSKN
jgi:hypothetical protein